MSEPLVYELALAHLGGLGVRVGETVQHGDGTISTYLNYNSVTVYFYKHEYYYLDDREKMDYVKDLKGVLGIECQT